MGKKDEASIGDPIAIAKQLEDASVTLADTLATHAEICKLAAQSMRAMHAALTAVQCPHTLTTMVTKEMVERGTEHRDPGKYCMTCGERIEKPKKPRAKKAKSGADAAAGDSSDVEGDGDEAAE